MHRRSFPLLMVSLSADVLPPTVRRRNYPTCHQIFSRVCRKRRLERAATPKNIQQQSLSTPQKAAATSPACPHSIAHKKHCRLCHPENYCVHGKFFANRCNVCRPTLARCEHNRKRAVCPICRCHHGLARAQCRSCSSLSPSIVDEKSEKCEHRVELDFCRACGGKMVCRHTNIKNNCHRCFFPLCRHSIRLNRCLECSATDYCSHRLLRWYCTTCSSSKGRFCPHGKPKLRCIKCNHCPHQQRKAKCRQCSPHLFCLHGQRRDHCRDCAVCRHGQKKALCFKCTHRASDHCIHNKYSWRCPICLDVKKNAHPTTELVTTEIS